MWILWTVFLFVVGACVGSFLNVVIYRLPRGESIVLPPSHCPSCGRAINWYDNVPLLSWVALGRRCRFCKAPISPRYVLVEAAGAAVFAGLYVCYYVLNIRDGAGSLGESWPTYLSHASLLCALLVCSVVDIQHWVVPLEVCWFVSLVGVAASASAPHRWMPEISPAVGAMSVGAIAGLIVAHILVRYGLMQRSFIDACERPSPAKGSKESDKPGKPAPVSVAVTRAHGVNPRREVLRELAFLAPAVVLAAVAWLLTSKVPTVAGAWDALVSKAGPGRHVNGLLAAALGYLVGGLWIWATRILGTLGFGKEAMGLGDVHLLAAVGAVTGWIIPSVVFFLAPLFGLLWAVYLWLARNQRELPYGPWLAAATLIVMLFYDVLAGLLGPYAEAFGIPIK